MEQIAYVNGAFVPMSDAKVSVLDRGFLFADGIYEVAAVLDGKLIDNASHLARLNARSARLRWLCRNRWSELPSCRRS